MKDMVIAYAENAFPIRVVIDVVVDNQIRPGFRGGMGPEQVQQGYQAVRIDDGVSDGPAAIRAKAADGLDDHLVCQVAVFGVLGGHALHQGFRAVFYADFDPFAVNLDDRLCAVFSGIVPDHIHAQEGQCRHKEDGAHYFQLIQNPYLFPVSGLAPRAGSYPLNSRNSGLVYFPLSSLRYSL